MNREDKIPQKTGGQVQMVQVSDRHNGKIRKPEKKHTQNGSFDGTHI